jgi:hypothetical protein
MRCALLAGCHYHPQSASSQLVQQAGRASEVSYAQTPLGQAALNQSKQDRLLVNR